MADPGIMTDMHAMALSPREEGCIVVLTGKIGVCAIGKVRLRCLCIG
jgi:hypothetical protein